jgi:hypothetical protein
VVLSPPGQHQAVHGGELVRRSNLVDGVPEVAQRLGVGVVAALEREDPEPRHHQPRLAMRSFSVSLDISMPGMPAPRPVLISPASWRPASRSWRRRWPWRAAAVLGQEDAAAHEHGLGAERHAQRRVGRGGDAARREVGHRQLAVGRPPTHQVVGRAEVLGLGHELLGGERA